MRTKHHSGAIFSLQATMKPMLSPMSLAHAIRHSKPLIAIGAAAALIGLVAVGATGCSDTTVERVGAPATGLPVDSPASGSVKIFLLTAHGLWPVWRDLGTTADPQAALDALAQGPKETERSRGISTALPATTSGLTATASNGRVDITLPWKISTINPDAVTQMACTVAAAPGIPGNLDTTEVLIVFHEPVDPLAGFEVRCDNSAIAMPVGSS